MGSVKYLEPTPKELDSCRLINFMREIRGQQYDHKNTARFAGQFGDTRNYDTDREFVLNWCRNTPEKELRRHSNELQMWWLVQDYTRHAISRKVQRINKALTSRGLPQLSKKELKTLGWSGVQSTR